MDEKEYEAEMIAIRQDLEAVKASLASTKRLVIWCAVAGAVVSILSKLLISVPVTVPIQPPASNTVSGGSVTIGAAKPESQRVFLTVAEVAGREQVSERTITDWISKGAIHPRPERDGRPWRIAADYRILPQSAAIAETKTTP